MKHHLIIVIFLFFAATLCSASEQIILTDKMIGQMSIKSKLAISLHTISKNFPYHRVTHEIRSGDSPDYHAFTVTTHDSEKLFTFISYIDKESKYEKARVNLDEIIVHSKTVKDKYGISIGMHVSEAIRLRKNMTFGAGHMDNYLGNKNIWYLFGVEDIHGTAVTEKFAIKSDPKIEAISWPYPRWR